MTDTDIAGATGSTYTVTTEDEGKALMVRVTFTDDAGNEESLTSFAVIVSPTLTDGSRSVLPTPTDSHTRDGGGGSKGIAQAANSPAAGVPTISGTARVGETLTADTSGVADGDGLTNADLSYQWTADSVDIEGGTSSSYTLTNDEVGKAIRVRVSFQDDGGNRESVTSVATELVAAKPLTAAIHDAPESHDGRRKFTFELRFSEDLPLSYRTLRDHAFTVTGGEVTKARRLERGKNIRWEIHVRPNSNAGVTIVLPVTTDCDAQGAICTGDGRMLSRRLELTVSGPGG